MRLLAAEPVEQLFLGVEPAPNGTLTMDDLKFNRPVALMSATVCRHNTKADARDPVMKYLAIAIRLPKVLIDGRGRQLSILVIASMI